MLYNSEWSMELLRVHFLIDFILSYFVFYLIANSVSFYEMIGPNLAKCILKSAGII